MNWQETEIKALEWYQKNYDAAAEQRGGHNSSQSDIYSPLNDFFIEVKKITPTMGARGGQVTEATAKQSEAAAALLAENPSEAAIKAFVQQHYTEKNVGLFLVFDGASFKLYTIQEFLDSFTFSLEVYEKRSGSAKLPKKHHEEVLAYNAAFTQTAAGIISQDSSTFGTIFQIGSNEFYIDYQGLIKKRSHTKNKTWQVIINEKKENSNFFCWE